MVYQAAGRAPDPRDYVDFESGPVVERSQVLRRLDTFMESIEEEISRRGSGRGQSLFGRD